MVSFIVLGIGLVMISTGIIILLEKGDLDGAE